MSARGSGTAPPALMVAVFGKHHIINPTKLHSNSCIKLSFEQWLAEVKGMPDFSGPCHELMGYFGEYAKDYSMTTYNYNRWEMGE